MKQPNYLDYCTEEIEELFGKYQDSVIKAIVKRIIKYGDVTQSTIEQLDILQESGLVYDDILNAISEYSVMAKELVSKAYNNTCLECISYDNALYSKAGIDKTVNVSPAVKQIVDAAIKKTNGNLQNITMTTAEASQQKFIDACSIAEMQISTGAFDVNTAIRQAIEYAIQDGVSVKYYDEDTGEVTATRNVVSAVRTAVLTGVSQTTGEIVFQNALDMGTDIIELSAHIGARPSHAVWQGKLVCISDRKTDYLTLADIGYGEVDGYKGINCRHYGFAFIEGVSKRVYTDKELEEMAAKAVTYNGNEMPVYEANKRQRAMERKIRAEKSELVGFNESIRLAKESGNKELADDLQISFDNLSVKLKRHEAIYKDFCKQTGLPELTERLQYTGFNRSVSQKAYNSANKHYKDWSKSIGAENAAESLAKYYDMKYNNPKEYALLEGYSNAIKKGEISPLVGFDLYQKTAGKIENELLNLTTVDGVNISDYHSHFVNRVIGQVENPHKGKRQGTPIEDVKEALIFGRVGKDHYRKVKRGTEIFEDQRRTYTGKKAKVTVSITEGKIIQTNPRKEQQ